MTNASFSCKDLFSSRGFPRNANSNAFSVIPPSLSHDLVVRTPNPQKKYSVAENTGYILYADGGIERHTARVAPPFGRSSGS